MAPPIPKHWTTDPEYIDLLNYLIKRAENVESPMRIIRVAIEFKEKSGPAQPVNCLKHRIASIRKKIHSFEHIDTTTKVKLLFALSASVDASFLKRMKKDAIVEVDDKKRITRYKANDGRLELKGDHSQSAKNSTAKLESKRSFRSLIINYFEAKNDADAITKNKEEKEMGNLIEFISEKCINVDKPINICQLARDFKNRFGISILSDTIQARVKVYCREIQKVEFLDTQTKVQQLFGLSATVDSDFLKELRKDAIVEIDEKNRITYYKATNGSLELRGDHSSSAKMKTAMLESKGSHRSMINSYFENKNDADAVPNNKEEKEMWNLIEFITEKCENVISPLSILQLTKDFNNQFATLIPSGTFWKRVRGYCREIQREEFLSIHTKVRQLFCLSATLDSACLKKLRKNDVVEVDHLSRITKYTANDGSLTLRGDHGSRAKGKLAGIGERKRKNTVKKHSNFGCDESKESEKENGYSEDDSDEYSSEEFDSEFDSDDENIPLDETEDLMDPSNETVDFDNNTPIRNLSPIGMSINDNFDFDPPTERSHATEETEMKENDENDPEIARNAAVKTQRSETLPKSKSSFSTSHTPKTPKRKADVSGGSSTSKRTKPSSDEPINLKEVGDNFSYDDPPRIELNTVRETLGFSNETQKDSDIQQIPKPCPQAIEASIKQEYEEKTQTSLQTVLKAFKSLILSLDNSGLFSFQMELDKKILETGRGVEVSNKEVIMAMDFLIVNLFKHGALQSSEDSISLRDILLMLRTIILNSSFNGLEVILEMLKENIEQLKVLDKKVPVSKVECVLRATLDSIST